MSSTLYQISEDLHALHCLLEETDGDVTDEQVAEAVEKWFSEIESNQNAKVNNYCKLIASLDYFSDIREAEGKRLELESKKFIKSSKVLQNRTQSLKDRLKWYMQVNNIPKISTDLYTVSVASNGGKAPLIYPESWDEDPASAPERFHRKIIKLDVENLRNALSEGEDVEGCKIGERGTNLRIR